MELHRNEENKILQTLGTLRNYGFPTPVTFSVMFYETQ